MRRTPSYAPLLALVAASLVAACSEPPPASGACATPCGPDGTFHIDHCDCNPGFIDRGRCCVRPPACSMPDDALEDNDTLATATPVAASGLARAGLRVCPGDRDVFRVPLTAGQRLEVALTFTHARGDLDVYVYAPGVREFETTRPAAASDGMRDNERLTYTATAAGEHVVLVTGFDAAENAYDLRVTVTGP